MNLIFDESIARWKGKPEYDEAALDERDKEFLATIPRRIAEETAIVRARLAAGAIYVVNGERNLVHDHNCPSLRHQMDRERAWKEATPYIVGSNRYAAGGPWHAQVKMPNLLTREEVEQLRRYSVCSICSPDTDTLRKRPRPDWYTLVTAANLTAEHLGRQVLDHREATIGALERITTTTDAAGTRITLVAGEHQLEHKGNDTIRLVRRNYHAPAQG